MSTCTFLQVVIELRGSTENHGDVGFKPYFPHILHFLECYSGRDGIYIAGPPFCGRDFDIHEGCYKNIIVDFGNNVNNKLAKTERLLYTDIVRFYE